MPIAQEWLKEAERLADAYADEDVGFRDNRRAALLGHLAARAQEQPKPNTEAAHQVAPVGTTLPPALSEDTRPIVWPKVDRVVRRDDMSQTGKLTVMVQRDGDVVVNVCKADGGEWESATVEFCAGGSGGGRSMRTREALIALMVAIEADNEARPIAAQAAQPKDAA